MRPFGQYQLRTRKELRALTKRPMRPLFREFTKRFNSHSLGLPFFKATDPLQGQSENGALAGDKISKLREESGWLY